MNKKILLIMSVFTLSITGCAEMTALNNQVGQWAGQINQGLSQNGITTAEQEKSGEFQVRGNVDDVFLKVRREFGFQPISAQHTGIMKNGYDYNKVYQAIPGNFYQVSGSFGDSNYLEVTIERLGKNQVNIQWEASGTERWLQSAKERLIRSTK
ncbi:hypothetical protein SAMN05660772_02049 [Pasteurella testudinis DSM 23072]|uniref:Uncharacterized protein n=1 Tax=Pasteurella testudinis DSM 23072 TaxID=1122938 RepID=A0A1W1UMJ4_9PAST|nr:hypothetical protein [Pasteurella testudinis]SMB82312.1 hypothetical protein SAMN05660772_02049 [Pasteurella testudinis DSM 23072]SUB51487.1 Uncharacterised protein [Pasteurella testudinis]